MSDLEAIADRVEIEALRGQFADAAMMRDYDRLLDGDIASGRAYVQELGRARDGRSHLNSPPQAAASARSNQLRNRRRTP